jgi:beta-1,2-mannobiose phosphorylase / 1,2-beta-oligomannan phosphorylase
VKFNEAGDPAGVERLGIALEPEADYERRPDGGGGCEDPRVTFVEPLQRYIMSYTAFSPRWARGSPWPESEDLFHWERLGLATYAHWHGIELGNVDDKDASLFPVAIPNSSGHPGTGHAPPSALSRHSPGGNAMPSMRPVRWISIGRASGFPIARRLERP